MNQADLIRPLLPYPSISSAGKTFGGSVLPQPPVCEKCRTKSCVKLLGGDLPAQFRIERCDKGMSCALINVGGAPLLINGVIINNDDAPPDSKRRKQYRSHKVSLPALSRLSVRLVRSVSEATASVHKAAAAEIAGLHDIRAAVAVVRRNAERIIFKDDAELSFETLKNAPTELRTLYESIDLLHSQLEVSSIYANPVAASYGRMRPTAIYKKIDRLCKIYQAEAHDKGVTFRLTGRSHNRPQCYDSMETLLMVVVDNAVKYAEPLTYIAVRVTDHAGNGVRLVLENIGPRLGEEEQFRIFDPEYRGHRAASTVSRGSGLGLYIAQIIARAHRTKLRYSQRPIGRSYLHSFCIDVSDSN